MTINVVINLKKKLSVQTSLTTQVTNKVNKLQTVIEAHTKWTRCSWTRQRLIFTVAQINKDHQTDNQVDHHITIYYVCKLSVPTSLIHTPHSTIIQLFIPFTGEKKLEQELAKVNSKIKDLESSCMYH